MLSIAITCLIPVVSRETFCHIPRLCYNITNTMLLLERRFYCSGFFGLAKYCEAGCWNLCWL